MIELAFIAKNREIVLFRIEGKTITYLDKFWQNGLQILPMQVSKVTYLKNSRSGILRQYATLIEEANKGESYEEYLKATSEEELAEIIKKDSASQGLIQVKK